jgi:outer membrane protein TolC
MQRTFSAYVLSALFASLTFAQQSVDLTLDEALQRAIRYSKVLVASRARLDQAELRTNEVSTAKLPSLTFQGGYTHLSPVPPFQFTPPFPNAEPVTIAPVILDQTQMRLQLQQILFAGGRIRATEEAASEQAHATADDYRNDERSVRLAVRQTYWNLYKLRATRRTFDQTIQQLQARIHDAENLLKAGLISSSDMLKLRVQLSTTRAQLLELESQEQSLTVQLNNLVSLPLNTTIRLATEPNVSDSLNTDLDAIIKEALATRPDLSASHARVRAAEASIASSTAAWFPTIALVASYLYANPNQRFLPNRKQFDGTWDIGISMSWNVWNWLQPHYQIGQARAQYEQARAAAELIAENTQVEITQNYVALRPARERISVAREAVAQAEDNYTQIVNRFTAGLATSTDVLEAESLLLQARTNEIAARTDYMLAHARFLNAIGK